MTHWNSHTEKGTCKLETLLAELVTDFTHSLDLQSDIIPCKLDAQNEV